MLGRAVPAVTAADVDVDRLAGRVLAAVQSRRATWSAWNLRAETERLTRPIPLAGGGERTLLVEAVQARAVALSAALPAAGRYTSDAILTAERAVLHAAGEPGGPVVPGAVVEEAIDRLASEGLVLGADQEAAVRALCTVGTAVRALVAPAGAGKTTTMRAVVLAHELAGQPRPVGLAQSSAAAAVLAGETGLAAENITKYRYEAEQGAFQTEWQLAPGQLMIVDEASLAGTLDAAALLTHARAAGGAVLLLGDPAQLSSPAAGGLLRLLRREGAGVELAEVRRFTDPWEGPASLRLRSGDTTVIGEYAERGRLAGGSRAEMVEAAYQGWRSDILAGRRSLLLAPENTNVAALNARARADRVAAGQVDPDGLRLRDGNPAGAGDLIVARRNDRTVSLGAAGYLRNGMVLEVKGIRPGGALAVRHPDTGVRAELPKHYLTRSVELGYAATIHRAQGMTSDTCHALIDAGTTREAAYVTATRGRDGNKTYAVTDELQDLEASHPISRGLARDPGEPAAPEDLWAAVLEREAVERSATETMTQPERERELDSPTMSF